MHLIRVSNTRMMTHFSNFDPLVWIGCKQESYGKMQFRCRHLQATVRKLPFPLLTYSLFGTASMNLNASYYSFKHAPPRHQYLQRYANRYCPLIYANAEFHVPGEAAQWSVWYGALIHP